LTDESQIFEDKGNSVPGYIVTFTDMVTLLLTFFVLLLSLAQVQDPEIFNIGRDSFCKSIRYCGLGMLFGKNVTLSFDEIKMRHLINSPENESETRGIDEQQIKTQRILERISRSTIAMPSQIVAEKSNFSVTNIRFPPGKATLDESAKKFLMEFCLDLQALMMSSAEPREANSKIGIGHHGAGSFYVLGLANETSASTSRGPQKSTTKPAETEKQQWILSAKRAKAVADLLETTLNEKIQNSSPLGRWQIYSWGAGPGGDWIGQDSPISKQSQILIAVLHGSS